MSGLVKPEHETRDTSPDRSFTMVRIIIKGGVWKVSVTLPMSV
jgi:hypothetical protein